MRWFNWRSWRRQRPVRRRLPRAFFETEPKVEEDVPPRGCAWFDSSRELRAGLSVREMLPGPELQYLLWAQGGP